MIQPAVMAPPLSWLVSDAVGGVTGRRFLAVHWDPPWMPSVPRRPRVPGASPAIAAAGLERHDAGIGDPARRPVRHLSVVPHRHRAAAAGLVFP
jgi:hypothetical protein